MPIKNQPKQFIIFLLIILLLNISGCLYQNDNINDNKTNITYLTIGIGENVYGFFPWLESYDVNTMMINMNIFNSLVEFDQIFRTKPKLATSWNNPNNLTWRFYLREDVKFHNGYNFSAEDVKFSIELIKNNESHVLRDLLISVKEVVIIDDYTVDIITIKPCPILLNKLVDIPIASKRYIEEKDSKYPIGTGAYRLIEYVPDEHIKLESFDDYWEDLEVENVTFKIIEDDEDMKNATINKEIDIACHIQSRFYDEIVNSSGLRIELFSQPTVFYLSFDFRENDSIGFKDVKNPLSDVRVRKAIYHAINISYIIDNIFNGSNFAEPASQFVTPLIFGYNPNIKRLEYDINRSKELMKKAGYENKFELNFDCIESSYVQCRISEILQSQLSEIIDVKINYLSIEDYYMKIGTRNISFYIIGWLAGTGDGGEIYDYLIRTVDQEAGVGTYNIGYYSNQEVDRIGENISHILNPKDRLKLMQEGFKIAMDDVAWIPLYSPKCIYCINDNIAWDPGPSLTISVEDIRFK
jgi:peptide/nickel transport system substrate-binding protein